MTPTAPRAATPEPRSPRATRRALLALLLLPFAGPARAADDKPIDGLTVQVPAAVTTASVDRLRSQLHGPLQRFEAGAARQGGMFRVLLDFNPDGRAADSDDFGACYKLATELRKLTSNLKSVQTVAWVHGPVRPTASCRYWPARTSSSPPGRPPASAPWSRAARDCPRSSAPPTRTSP